MSNKKSIFENVTFLNEGPIGTGLFLGLGGLMLAAEIKERIDRGKERKSGCPTTEQEFNKIMSKFKALAKSLDNYRSKFKRYKWVSDAQPEYHIKDSYYDIFKKEFNKGHGVRPYYSIIFEENDYDNLDYNVDRTFKFFEDMLTQFCNEHGFKTIDGAQCGHMYMIGKDSEKFEGFEVKFFADTEFSLCIEYDKNLIKKK